MGMKFSVDGGGAANGGSPRYEAIPADISSTGGTLSEISSTIRSSRSYGAVEGVGDYTTVASAVAERVSAWNPSLDTWQSSLDSLGSATRDAAVAIEQTDANLHQAWSAAASALPGHP